MVKKMRALIFLTTNMMHSKIFFLMEGDFHMSLQVIHLKIKQYLTSHISRIHESKSSGLYMAQKKIKIHDKTLAFEIAKKLTSWRFCRQRPTDFDSFVGTIENRVKNLEPIQIIAGHGPLKNMNNCNQSVVDWAEFFTYTYM